MERVRRYFDRDRLGKELGIQLTGIQPGVATARMTITEKHHNSIGIAHGGAIFTLADIAFAAASNSHGTVAVGVNASIAYLKAVSSGTLTARAREISRGSKLATYVIEVTDESGDPVAAFQGTVYRKKDEIPL